MWCTSKRGSDDVWGVGKWSNQGTVCHPDSLRSLRRTTPASFTMTAIFNFAAMTAILKLTLMTAMLKKITPGLGKVATSQRQSLMIFLMQIERDRVERVGVQVATPLGGRIYSGKQLASWMLHGDSSLVDTQPGCEDKSICLTLMKSCATAPMVDVWMDCFPLGQSCRHTEPPRGAPEQIHFKICAGA